MKLDRWLGAVTLIPLAGAFAATDAIDPGCHLAAADFDIRDFGALGDGRSDDAPAIRRAIEAASRGGGGRVLFPQSGEPYVVSGTISIRASGVELCGSGATLKLDGARRGGKTVHLLEIVGTASAPVKSVAVRGLSLDANYWEQEGAYRPRALQVTHAQGVLIERVTVRRSWVGLTFGAGAVDCEARDCLITEWHNDAYSASGDGTSGGCRGIRFLRCRAAGSPDESAGGLPGRRNNAWEIEDGAVAVSLAECVVDRCGGNGFAVRSHAGGERTTRDIEFLRCQALDVSGLGWYVAGRNESVRTIDVRIVDSISHAPVSLARGAEQVVLRGSRIDGSLCLGLGGEGDFERARKDPSFGQSLPLRSVEVLDTQASEVKILARPGKDGSGGYVPEIRLVRLWSGRTPEILGSGDNVSVSGARVDPLGPLPPALRWNYHTPPRWAPERDRWQHRLPLLSPLVLDGGGTVSSPEEWFRLRRPQLIAHWTRILGKLEPAPEDRMWFGDAARAVIHGRKEKDGYTRIHLGIPMETDFLQDHLLLLPRGVRGPSPAVIAWTSTTPDFRKPEEWWGAWLARRGYVVLTGWSFIRHYRNGSSYAKKVNEVVYERFGHWLPMAKMAHDVRREVEYLRSRPEVDGERIGFMGFSLSAKAALYVGAFAEEIRATVSIDPHVALQGNTNYHDPWYLDWKRTFPDIETSDYPLPERRGTVLSLLDPKPFRPGLERNHHEILALCAPRPFLVIGCSMDREGGAPHSDDRQSWAYYNRAKEVYALLGVPERLQFAAVKGGHRATGPEVDRAWQRFFERWLRNE